MPPATDTNILLLMIVLQEAELFRDERKIKLLFPTKTFELIALPRTLIDIR